MNLARFLEATELHPEVSTRRILELAEEANRLGYRGICIHPRYVSLARRVLSYGVELVAVVGFPFGMNRTETKVMEAELAAADGATELDVVIALGPFGEGDEQTVRRDLEAVVRAAGSRAVKAIIETGFWSPEMQVKAARLAADCGARWVKTSTGYGPPGPTPEVVARLRAAVGPEIRIKASGGIRRRDQAEELIRAGADALGTSRAFEICQEGDGSSQG